MEKGDIGNTEIACDTGNVSNMDDTVYTID